MFEMISLCKNFLNILCTVFNTAIMLKIIVNHEIMRENDLYHIYIYYNERQKTSI